MPASCEAIYHSKDPDDVGMPGEFHHYRLLGSENPQMQGWAVCDVVTVAGTHRMTTQRVDCQGTPRMAVEKALATLKERHRDLVSEHAPIVVSK